MLIRICLIVAIVAGLAAAGLGFIKVGEKIKTIMAERDNERSLKETALGQLADTNQVLEATQQELTRTRTELTNTVASLREQTERATVQERRANALAEELAQTKTQRDNAQAELAAWNALGIPVDQIRATLAKLKDLEAERDAIEEEKKILARTITRLENKVNILLGGEGYQVPLPRGLKGEVVVVDPKWEFVVLNIGEEQGVLENGEMLVNRDGRLVGKVRIKTVQKDRSIANVVPGWKLGDVMEGDVVIVR